MFQIGDIFVASWGYNMTLVDFYQVVGITPNNVKLRRVASRVTDKPSACGYGTGYVIPVRGEFTSAPFMRRLPTYSDGFVRGHNSSAYAKIWNGNPVWFNTND